MKNQFHRSRRKRPNFQEAQDFIRKGHSFVMRSSDYVTVEERKQRIRELSDGLKTKIKAHIPRSRNLELVILKCHLLIEYMFDEFIDLMAPTEGIIKNERFTFKQKEALVHMLGFTGGPIFFPSVDLLNKLRNQVAHTLEINRDTVDELIMLNSDEPDDINGIDDAERTKAIKQITKFMCFYILGAIEGMHTVLYMDEVKPGT